MARKTEIVKKNVTLTNTIVTITCDFCGCKASSVCHICGRDVCKRHSRPHYERDEYNGEMDYGDGYPPRWCEDCESVYKKYEKEIDAEYSRHEEVAEKLELLWTTEAKELAKERRKV